MMKRLFSKIVILIILFLSILNFQIATSANVSAACNTKFLNIPTWYDGLVDSECKVKSPAEFKTSQDPSGIGVFTAKIVTNIIEILLGLIGYLAFGFVLYGSFLFITSSGNSDAVSRARQTIFRAIIGLVIGLGGGAIVKTLSNTLNLGGELTPDNALKNIINLVIQIAITTTVIVIIISGFRMITGGDNPDAIQKARRSIVYALIGLILSFGSFAIVNYVLTKF